MGTKLNQRHFRLWEATGAKNGMFSSIYLDLQCWGQPGQPNGCAHVPRTESTSKCLISLQVTIQKETRNSTLVSLPRPDSEATCREAPVQSQQPGPASLHLRLCFDQTDSRGVLAFPAKCGQYWTKIDSRMCLSDLHFLTRRWKRRVAGSL